MRLAVFALSVLLTAFNIVPSHADRRVALVVGNAAYRHADRLTNPINDARGMRAALTKLGFEIIYGEDLDQQALRRAVGRFATVVEDADVAIVYFAGHGATFADTPYVVPVDAAFSSPQQVPYELVPAETLIGELRRAKGVRIAILDACRDNTAERELKRQAAQRGGEVSRGLGPMKNPDGLILAYATQYLSTAVDVAGANRNSPFTAALLNNIATPDVDVKDMFFRVGRDVITATQGKQRPEISISMYDQYVLVPSPPKSVAAAAPPATSAAVPAPATPVSPPPAPARPPALQQTAVVAPPVTPVVPPSDPCGGTVTVSSPSRCAAPLSAAQERGLKATDSFRECEQCPVAVVVPAGTFTMGGAPDEEGVTPAEVPQHHVALRQAFAVGRFSVTFDEWDACVADGGCNGYRPDDRGWGRGRRPVINVSWNEAKSYVAWLSRTTGKAYRLLSEAEREYVTRAGATTPFWWGASISTEHANYDGRNYYNGGSRGEFRQRTLPVDSFEPNAWGLYQVHGNVWEWTEDCAHDNYKGAPSDGSAWTTGGCDKRIGRGGSWYDRPSDLRAAHREKASASERSNSVGFRVARTLLIPTAPE
jgi:formylglycine-generating enzyme required for sulfatase activity